ncbi:MAG: ABC transporter ATP-binding protein [Anaerolineaceae bacterium]
MILAEDLTKRFDDLTAVDRVNLDVKPGQVLALLGPNGAGKTTTVRMLTSVLSPTSGRAVVAGYDVIEQPDRVRASVGVLTEQHGLYTRMNAEEYLQYFGQLYRLDPSFLRRRMEQLLTLFGLGGVKKKLGEYSKGMRQKLALVRALLHDPPVLLLDEPTSAMDPESSRMVRDSIQSLRSADRTIILCTHNLIEAEELADQVAIIRRGRIILYDTLEVLKQKLLGPVLYEARLAKSGDHWNPRLPEGVTLTGQGEYWLRFQIVSPLGSNPQLLKKLLDDHLEVVTFAEIPRSLEQVYLEGINREEQGGQDA